MSEGGEQKQNTNINAMLEQLGIYVNNDSVIRKTFFKYLHPKEAYIGNGILNDELVRYTFLLVFLRANKLTSFLEWLLGSRRRKNKSRASTLRGIRTPRMICPIKMKTEV